MFDEYQGHHLFLLNAKMTSETNWNQVGFETQLKHYVCLIVIDNILWLKTTSSYLVSPAKCLKKEVISVPLNTNVPLYCLAFFVQAYHKQKVRYIFNCRSCLSKSTFSCSDVKLTLINVAPRKYKLPSSIESKWVSISISLQS